MTKVKAKNRKTPYLRGVDRHVPQPPKAAGPAEHLLKFDPEELVLACFRYFVGRMTIATCCFAQCELTAAWPELPRRLRNTIKKELSAMFKLDDVSRATPGKAYHPLGHYCDRKAWECVLAVATTAAKQDGRTVKRCRYLRHFDARMLLVGAFRWHLGEDTKAAADFARALASAWPLVPEIDRNIIRRELEEALERDTQDTLDIKCKYRTLGSEGMREGWLCVHDVYDGGCPKCGMVQHQCLCSHGN